MWCIYVPLLYYYLYHKSARQNRITGWLKRKVYLQNIYTVPSGSKALIIANSYCTWCWFRVIMWIMSDFWDVINVLDCLTIMVNISSGCWNPIFEERLQNRSASFRVLHLESAIFGWKCWLFWLVYTDNQVIEYTCLDRRAKLPTTIRMILYYWLIVIPHWNHHIQSSWIRWLEADGVDAMKRQIPQEHKLHAFTKAETKCIYSITSMQGKCRYFKLNRIWSSGCEVSFTLQHKQNITYRIVSDLTVCKWLAGLYQGGFAIHVGVLIPLI